jgi:pyruvate dehydrogenase E2 component (dihydrolipoamide acetyltransferase)
MEGTLLYIGVEEGNAAAVDSVLAIIGNEGEDISGLQAVQLLRLKVVLKRKNRRRTKTETATCGTASAEVPAGVEVITMPRLSDTMTEGKVAKWHKNVGDTVKEGDLLAEIETDKAVQDFESEFNGVLLKQGVEEGGAAPVDSVLAIIGPAGTDVSGVGAPKAAASSSENLLNKNRS